MRDSQHPGSAGAHCATMPPPSLTGSASTARKTSSAASTRNSRAASSSICARASHRPSALADVFAKFKDWLTRIYQTLQGLGAPINDDIRRVFDRMLDRRAAAHRDRAGAGAGQGVLRHSCAGRRRSRPARSRGPPRPCGAEKQSYLNDLPPEVRNELDAALAKAQKPQKADSQEKKPAEPAGAADRGASQDQQTFGARSRRTRACRPRAALAARNLARSSQAEATLAEKALAAPERAGSESGAGACSRRCWA
jgi:hypothetical protein